MANPICKPDLARRINAVEISTRAVTETARSGKRRAADSVLTVVWEHWKITQSEFHYRPAGEIDLGEIEGDPIFPLESGL